MNALINNYIFKDTFTILKFAMNMVLEYSSNKDPNQLMTMKKISNIKRYIISLRGDLIFKCLSRNLNIGSSKDWNVVIKGF